MGKISSLADIQIRDESLIRRVRVPELQTIYQERAKRLRDLAKGNSIADYLGFMALLVDAQHDCAQTLKALPLDKKLYKDKAQQGEPLINPIEDLDPQWQGALKHIFKYLLTLDAKSLPEQFTQIAKNLLNASPKELDQQAQAVLTQYPREIALAPFIAAALQVVYATKASGVDEHLFDHLQLGTSCPICAGGAVASVIRLGAQGQNLRYLHCGVCESQWHMVHVKCTHCASIEGIAYEGVEQSLEYVKAETCEQCYTYCKVFNQEKDAYAEPIADDLATLALDLLMAQTKFTRASVNPLMPFAAVEKDASEAS